MRTITRMLAAAACAVACWSLPAGAQSQDPPPEGTMTPQAREAERQARLQLAERALQKLYGLQPEAREAVGKGVGYAVFEVDSIYAVLFVGQKGKGVLIDNATKKPTFMSSARAGTGPGVGKQKVLQVFVFKSKGAMDQFVLGGKLGGDVGASVSTGREGMVRSFNPSIDIYQVPESGMAVQASWGGTVYTVDTQLE